MGARLRVPDQLAYSELGRETVVFDLQTGTYRSYPRKAAHLLALIERHGSMEAAAAEVARETGHPLDSVRGSVAAQCVQLIRSGLLEVDRGRPTPRRSGERSPAA
jgi:hypothetical protein